MAHKPGKQIVIDASVARASGGESAVHPISKYCRDFLITMISTYHRIVMTAEINEEWNRNQSNFARRWRISMVARRREEWVEYLQEDRPLLDKIERCMNHDKAQRAIQKDYCLIRAAFASDKTITSLDEVMRSLLMSAAVDVGELRDFVWVNPGVPAEKPLDWLGDGAKADKDRKLGARLF